MQRKRGRSLLVLITVAAAAAFAAPAVLGAGPNFDVVSHGTVTFGFPPTCAGVFITETGTSAGTHIGGSGLFAAEECAGATAIGQATITATNGDRLTLNYQTTNSTIDLSTGDFQDAGTFQFTGGTGRFAGASGSGTFTASGNFFAGATTTEFVGSLDLGPGRG